MDRRKQVLIVTNAMTEEEVSKIRSFRKEYEQKMDIRLSLVHVIPRIPAGYFNTPSIGMLVEKCYDEAKASLSQVGKYLDVAKKDQWLISGKVRTEVLRLAGKLGSSFILASSHQIQELQRSLFFKNIHQYALIKTVKQLENIQ